ncbi:MAG: creatininase family protein [Opitutaceae bacterium]
MTTSRKFTARPFVLHEANYKQLQELQPNLAVLPWGATEAHNYHLPHGTDVTEANGLGERAVERANEQGARCVLLPCVPFGIDHSQTASQVATITMRASTQQAVLRDVAESLVRQGIDRLVLLNFHGGNDFRSMIRDVAFDLPIFIVQVNGYEVADAKHVLDDQGGDHANEFETCLLLHLAPEWVAPLETAGDGAFTKSELPALSSTPGVWFSRDWPAFTKDTGVGNPKQATAEKGRKVMDLLVDGLAPVLVELSRARPGQFPFIIRNRAQDAGGRDQRGNRCAL